MEKVHFDENLKRVLESVKLSNILANDQKILDCDYSFDDCSNTPDNYTSNPDYNETDDEMSVNDRVARHRGISKCNHNTLYHISPSRETLGCLRVHFHPLKWNHLQISDENNSIIYSDENIHNDLKSLLTKQNAKRHYNYDQESIDTYGRILFDSQLPLNPQSSKIQMLKGRGVFTAHDLSSDGELHDVDYDGDIDVLAIETPTGLPQAREKLNLYLGAISTGNRSPDVINSVLYYMKYIYKYSTKKAATAKQLDDIGRHYQIDGYI